MADQFSLNNKNVLITGASSGIGRQCAITVSRGGATCILIARNNERLQETISLMRGGDHLAFGLDVLEMEKIPALVDAACTKIGKISGFIHSAGVEMTLPLRAMKEEHYKRLFLVNVISGFEFVRVLANKKYLDDLGGSFIFISSVMGMVGEAGSVGYCASKGALNSGVKALALELASKKVRVNSVCPGYVDTELTKRIFSSVSEEAKNRIINMHPLGIGTPEDIANVCAFLLSKASRWITGVNIVVDGGYSAH